MQLGTKAELRVCESKILSPLYHSIFIIMPHFCKFSYMRNFHKTSHYQAMPGPLKKALSLPLTQLETFDRLSVTQDSGMHLGSFFRTHLETEK